MEIINKKWTATHEQYGIRSLQDTVRKHGKPRVIKMPTSSPLAALQGPVLVIWRCRKNFSQWQHSCQWKLCPHWLNFLRQHHVSVVIQAPAVWRYGNLRYCQWRKSWYHDNYRLSVETHAHEPIMQDESKENHWVQFQYKDRLSGYDNSHYQYIRDACASYLYNVNTYIGKTACLDWEAASGACLNIKMSSNDHLIFSIGIPIHGKTVLILYTETPRGTPGGEAVSGIIYRTEGIFGDVWWLF